MPIIARIAQEAKLACLTRLHDCLLGSSDTGGVLCRRQIDANWPVFAARDQPLEGTAAAQPHRL